MSLAVPSHRSYFHTMQLPTPDKPGLRLDALPAEQYFGCGGYSSTDVKNWLSMTPKEWRYWKQHGIEPSDAMRLGSAIHCAVLEPAEYESRFAVYSGDRRTGKAYREWADSVGNREELSRGAGRTVEAVIDYLEANERLHKLIKSGSPEVSFLHLDLQGRLRKARCDWIGDIGNMSAVIDLKTTWSLDDRHLEKTLYERNYHVQAAWYLDVVGAVNGREPDAFVIIWVATKPPIDMRLTIVSKDAIELGRESYKVALDQLSDAQERDYFPGYPMEPTILDLPRWAYTKND